MFLRLAIVGLILWAAIAAASCALLDDAAVAAARVVGKACAEPEPRRELIAQEINQRAAPNSITLNCAVPPATK